MIFKEDRLGGRIRVTVEEERRDQVVEILRLISSENLVCDRKEFIFDTFIYSEPVKRSKNRSDVTRFWGSGDSNRGVTERPFLNASSRCLSDELAKLHQYKQTMRKGSSLTHLT